MAAEACIVCLGDLIDTESYSLQHLNADSPPSSAIDHSQLVPNEGFAIENHLEDIAHLLPCGHNLHNDCLKPWVERANSCPICRQNFNVVELRSSLNGKLNNLRLSKKLVEVNESIPQDLASHPMQSKTSVNKPKSTLSCTLKRNCSKIITNLFSSLA